MKIILPLFILFITTLFFANCNKKIVVPTSYALKIFDENYEGTISETNAKNQNACIMIHASWCSVCNKFKANVLTDSSVVNTINNKIVFALIDGDKTYGKTYFDKYGINSFPTFVIVDKNGNAITKLSGGLTASEFKAFVSPYLK
jgi:thioredoxin 1